MPHSQRFSEFTPEEWLCFPEVFSFNRCFLFGRQLAGADPWAFHRAFNVLCFWLALPRREFASFPEDFSSPLNKQLIVRHLITNLQRFQLAKPHTPLIVETWQFARSNHLKPYRKKAYPFFKNRIQMAMMKPLFVPFRVATKPARFLLRVILSIQFQPIFGNSGKTPTACFFERRVILTISKLRAAASFLTSAMRFLPLLGEAAARKLEENPKGNLLEQIFHIRKN